MKHSKHGIKKAVEQTGQFIGENKGEKISQMTNRASEQYNSIKDIVGLSDESAESIYGQAYLLYNTGRYRDASQIFRLLIMLNSTEPKYLMGLAACFHMLKEYATAGGTYNLVTILDPDNPIPFFHASDCYIQMGDKLSAIAMLEMAVKRAGDKPAYATLKQRAQISAEALKKELQIDSPQASPAKPNVK